MDLWLVAAATGAGYIAKYRQQLASKEREESLLESTSRNSVSGQLRSHNSFQEFQNQPNPLHKHSWKETGRDFPSGREDSSGFAGLPSTSGSNIDRDENQNVLSLSSSLPGFNTQGFQQETGSNSTSSLPIYPRSKVNLQYRPRSRGDYVTPANSFESGLMAQLCRENARMEEYTYSSLQAPSNPVVRPLLVTDGRRVISRASRDFRGEMQMEEDEMPLGGARRMSNLGMSRKPRPSTYMSRPRRMSSYSSRVSLYSRRNSFTGSSNRMLLFFPGITTGIISSTIANRREVDKLKEMLDQTQNLSKDLHEELEMKDSLPVKELAYEDSALQSDDYKSEGQLHDHSEEKSESMSKIEAELEAELERLGLSVSSSNFEPDRSHSDQDVSESSSNHTVDVNYAVSPWELSIRLHEVIQSRLEARIAELERALENSQKKVQYIQSERMAVQRNEYSETESSTQSPFFMEEEDDSIDQPLVLNLSGEALEAYKEAHEEIFNMDISDSREDGSVPEHDNSRDWGFNDLEGRGGEEEDEDDEFGQLMIKQIVEKTRQGSRALLNAQRMLDSIDNQ